MPIARLSWIRLLALALATAAAATPVRAQQVGGGLTGVVRDATGRPIADASVTAIHTDTSVTRVAQTDTAGRYRLVPLPAGDYDIAVVVAGFAAHRQRIEVPAGRTVAADVRLEVTAGHETIQVVASAVQRESTELSGVIDRDRMLAVPLNGRSFDQLPPLEPGVFTTTSRETSVLYQHGLKININGASSRSNAFLLDGTTITDVYNNGLGSAAGTMLGLEGARAVRVLTNAYDASHGGVAGGVVSIVTKSGSNQLHGSGFGLFRDGRLDAKGFFDSEKPAFWRRQGGFAAGGPIVRDRLVFFATGEWLRESKGLTQVTIVPSVAARSGTLRDPSNAGATIAVNAAVRPFLDLFPVPNGTDFGDGLAEHRFDASRPTRENFGQARLDYALAHGGSLFVRLTADAARKSEPADFPDSTVDWDSSSRFLTVEHSQPGGGTLVNTARASYSSTELAQNDTTGSESSDALAVVPGRGIPHLAIGGMPVFGSLVSPHTRARQRILGLSDDLTLTRGSHLIKTGLRVERFDALLDFQIFWTGRYSFPGIVQFLQGRPSVLSLALPGSDALRELTTTQFASYVQDDVKLSPSMTLSAGLRWEFATAPRESEDRLIGLRDVFDTETVRGTLLQTHKANLAPRLGLAWAPGGGRTVVRAGGGLFYDINTLPFVTQTVGNNPPFFRQVTLRNPAFPVPSIPATQELSLAVPQYDWQTPRLVHFNTAVERELRGQVTVRVAYAGSRGRHIVRSGDINAPVPDTLADGTRVFPAGGRRRNPAFGAITYRTPDGSSTYDALEVKASARPAAGVQFHAAYTLSRAVDETQGTVPTESNGSVTQWMDPDRRATDRGPADFDRRHNLTATFVAALPPLGRAPALLRHALGGVTVSGILALRSGNPFTVGIQGDYARTLARVSVHRPDLRPGVDADDIVLGGHEQYFDPSAFVLPAPGTFGNLGRNSLTGPGLATFDVAVAKDLPLRWGTPHGTLQLRLEAFNLFNRVNLGMPQRIVFAGVRQDEAPIASAGRITSTTTGPRELQLGLRVAW